MGPRFRRTIGALFTLVIVGGIGVGVYFGVTRLVEKDDAPGAEVVETVEVAETEDAEGASTPSAAAEDAQPEDSSAAEPSAVEVAPEQQPAEDEPAADDGADAAESTTAEQEASPSQQRTVAISSIEPTVSDQQVTPAQIGGAEVVAERVTAEPVPAGIPRSLADGAAYDPSEPATVFTSRWPVGTTLRLTRLPGATVLSDEEQEQVVGTIAMVVVRGSESSNTDLQLSPAAFDLIAFHGTERIIAVRVEVTAAPP